MGAGIIMAMSIDQMEEVLPSLWRIPVPLKGNPLKELNSYVILGGHDGAGGKNLLIDTGFRTKECREALEEGLSCLKTGMRDTDILLTHLHADHCGNGPDLVEKGSRMFISRIDGKLMTGQHQWGGVEKLHEHRAARLEKNGIPRPMIQQMLDCTPSRSMAPDPGYGDYTFLDEDDVIEAGRYRLKAIYTPGHTPGQMCFEIMGTGAMILGDHVLFDITPNITDWPGVEDALGDYLDSLSKIDGYDVVLPLPGHRKRGDFHGRIEEIKAHHRQRLEECCQVIKGLGKAKLYDIAGKMTWKIKADGWDGFPPAQRWFALGECLSHIDHLKRIGRVVEHEEGGMSWYEA